MPDTNIGIQHTSVNETEPLLRDANEIGGLKCYDEGYEKSEHWKVGDRHLKYSDIWTEI